MQENNIISFLVIFYNQEKYVERALEHILNIQIPEGFQREILIGDDGSTDGTQNKIKEYLQQYPEMQIYIMPRDEIKDPSKRSGENRLNLLKQIKGKYFCIADGDDFYSNTKWILKAVPILNADSTLSMVAFQHEIIDAKGNPIPSTTFHLSTGKHHALEYIQSKTYTHAAACLFRAPTATQLAFLIRMNSFVDTHIVLAFLSFGNIYIYHKVVYSYQATGGIWLSYNEAEQHLRIALSFCFLSYYFPQFKKEFQKTHYNSLEFLFLHRHNFWNILKISNEKSMFYKTQLKQPINLFLNQVLNFDNLSNAEKKSVKTFFRFLFFRQMKRKIKMIQTQLLHYLKNQFPFLKTTYKKAKKLIDKK